MQILRKFLVLILKMKQCNADIEEIIVLILSNVRLNYTKLNIRLKHSSCKCNSRKFDNCWAI